MRRFILLTFIGGLTVLAGHALVSIGLHPERLAAPTDLLKAGGVLVIGCALFITGMLGLAEGYERVSSRVGALLEAKQLTDAAALPVADTEALRASGRLFWQGYSAASGGLVLFLGGLLLLTAILTRSSPQMFVVGLGAGIVTLAVAALALCLRGLFRLRRAHAGADESARRLARLPDRRPEVDERAAARRPRTSRYPLFQRETARSSRGLARKNLDAPRPPAETASS